MNVAVVGASRSRSKFGNKAVRAYAARGHTVFPVNPHEETIEGLPVYRTVTEIPVTIDATLVYLPPPLTAATLPEIAEKGTGTLYLNPGSEDGTVLSRARELGLDPICACAIVAIGESPSNY